MKHGTRIAKLTAISVGVIILTAVILSRFIFSTDKLTALVLPRISQILNRDVSAEGVELSFFPTIGIRITGLRVSNPPYGKFDSPYLLDSKTVVIDAKILPLFKNRLEINNVIFFSPTIYVEENGRNRVNTDQLLSDSFYKETKDARGSLSSLLLSNFEIINGTIIWYNSRTGMLLKFLNADLNSKIETVVLEDKLVLSSNVYVRKFELWKGNSQLYEASPISVEAKLDYDKRHGQINIESQNTSVFGVSIRSSIGFSFYPRTQMNVYVENSDSSASSLYNLLPSYLKDVIIEKSIRGKLSFEFGYKKHDQSSDASFRLNLSDLRATLQSGDSLSVRSMVGTYFSRDDSSSYSISIPSAILGENFASIEFDADPAKGGMARVLLNLELKKLARTLGFPSIDKLSGSVKARYSFNYDSKRNRTQADGLLTFADALVQIPIGIDTLYTGEFDGTISLKNNRATFNKLLLRLGASDVVLTGTLTDYQDMLTGRNSSIPSLKLKMVSKTFSSIGLLPHMNLNIGRQTLAWLPKASISLDFNIGKCILPNDTLFKFSGSLQVQDYFVRLNRINYVSPWGTFAVSGWTDYGQEGKITFGLKSLIATWSFGKMVERYFGGREIAGGTGKGILTINGVCDDSGRVDLAGLGGRGQFTVSNVQIKDYSVLGKLYDYLGVNGKDSLKINSSSFSVEANDGRLYFNKLIAYGTPFDFRLDGWQGFDGTLDYKLGLRVYPPMGAQIVTYLKSGYPDLAPAPDGVLGLSLVAGGTTSDARFTIVGFNTKLADGVGAIPQNFLYTLK